MYKIHWTNLFLLKLATVKVFLYNILTARPFLVVLCDMILTQSLFELSLDCGVQLSSAAVNMTSGRQWCDSERWLCAAQWEPSVKPAQCQCLTWLLSQSAAPLSLAPSSHMQHMRKWPMGSKTTKDNSVLDSYRPALVFCIWGVGWCTHFMKSVTPF